MARRKIVVEPDKWQKRFDEFLKMVEFGMGRDSAESQEDKE